jgi:hypothetical protein
MMSPTVNSERVFLYMSAYTITRKTKMITFIVEITVFAM